MKKKYADGRARVNVIRICLNDEEKEKLNFLCEESKNTTSELVRELILNEYEIARQ